MAVYLKTFVFITFVISTLAACKPGIYYTFGQSNVQQNTSAQASNAPPPMKLGELTTTDI